MDRALSYLRDGPADSPRIARDVLAIPNAPPVVAERLAVALLGADPRVRRDHTGDWRLAHARLSLVSLAQCTFAVVDVETTGARWGGDDRIPEIAVVLVSRGRIETALESLVNPLRAIPAVVSRITQITGAMVQSAPTFGEIVDDVLAALAGRVFVAHNVGFDWRFVSAEVRRARDLQLDGPKLCTVKLTRRFLPSLKNRGLDSVARYFGVEIEHRHRAGGDARATALILKRLLDTAAEQGATTLEDVSGVPPRPGRRKRRPRGPTWMDAI